MISDILFLLKLLISFLPFILFAFFNSKANVKKENRNRQYSMPVVAVLYSAVLLIFMKQLSNLFAALFLKLADLFDWIKLAVVANFIRNLYNSWGVFLTLILFNTAALILFVIAKRIITAILGRIKVKNDTTIGSIVGLFYLYDEEDNRWYIREHFGQARTFIKTAYYGGCFVSGLALLISCSLCMNNLVSAPFYPVFAVIVIGEAAFFIDGLEKGQQKAELTTQFDNSQRIAMYPMLRKPLKALFGDKLSAEGTTVNNGGLSGGAIEDVLVHLEKNGGHIGENYASFIRRKMEKGLRPNVDYVRCGYDLAIGKSLLFNTPFYDKLNPYVFYAMNRELLTGGKILIVLGRHGTEEDLYQWMTTGIKAVSNIPDLWKIAVLSDQKVNEESMPDIGIISRSAVHDLDSHKNNLPFLRNVSFVVVIEPSKLVTTAQIGLNLLIKCCGKERPVTFCSVDRNCDGLVDALSHILMTNITEVSATEYPHGMSSYMYWTADDDYLQHRLLPGVSRFLGMGTELSMVALKNQVKKAVWYGGEAFPVFDAHWIAKQYYYDLLDYAQLPTNQETFDSCFQTSFNMCNERVSDYSYITVEDDRNNLFETRRNFATIAEQQGFVNVISSEYMLREYMSDNTEIFTADPKAIPYITADYARTKRNSILSLCLLLCLDSVTEEMLLRQLTMLNIETNDPVTEIWEEVCKIFSTDSVTDKQGNPILSVKTFDGKTISFEKNETILFKRQYSIETGKFESVYTIENADFSRIILDDLQNASYIAEQESKDVYIGTELKGHVYQKYMPGQFFTLNGKYYEMVSTALNNRILVRRASEHIGGRLSYRQIRNYTIHHLEDSLSMGALKSVNDIGIHYQYADFSVDTLGYWKLRAHNDFDNGDLVQVNGVPTRTYHSKQILKFDFSKFGDAFTDTIRMTLTNLLNEVFVTLFADNQAYISAVTPGSYDAPLTYSLELAEEIENADKCIFVIEDSQLDIGLLIAVERNIHRILQIISDYLSWNGEKIAESIRSQTAEKEAPASDNAPAEEEKPEKKGFFKRIGDWFKGLFKKKGKNNVPEQDYMMIYGKPHKKINGEWVPCSQEEFDEKMAMRHKALEEQKQAEKDAASENDPEASEDSSEPKKKLSPFQRLKAALTTKLGGKKARQEEESSEDGGEAEDTVDAQETDDVEDGVDVQETADVEDGVDAQDSAPEPEETLTPKQRKQQEKAAKKAAKEELKKKKQEEKLRKKQEKAKLKNAEAATNEAAPEEASLGEASATEPAAGEISPPSVEEVSEDE